MSTTPSTAGLGPLDKLSVLYENKKKPINMALGAVVLLVAGYFGYKNLIQKPNAEKAALAIVRAEQMYAIDSVNVALNGDGQNVGFLKIIKKYDGTPSANVAHFYAGSCYLKMGDFKSAVKHLNEFDSKGTIFAHAKSGLLGDAHMEQGDYKKAIEYFNAAVSDADDDVFTPRYLNRLALAYQKNNQEGEAKKAYIRIRDEYPRSMESRDVDRYLARLGVLE